ncbi:MAG: ABC transporter permease [Clostridiales bacterium]|jgi:oligopeptide transport system permease protein|nr:ABC transporter permease [Clostridiales bacterium]
MAKYILKRCVIAIFTLLTLVTIIFVLVRMLPGDPFASEKTNAAIQAKMRAYYGLDKPIHEQWLTYVTNLIKGNLGVSLKYPGRTINAAIAQTFHYSAELGVRALLVALAAGLLLGMAAAQKVGGIVDYICIFAAVLFVSVPDFVSGSLLQLIFAVKLKWLPATQWESWRHMILPVAALSFYTIALIARLMRSSMLDVIHQDYILTAKAKGLSSFQIIWRHQIRNSILPIITVMGPIVAAVLTGTFVLEKIYGIKGMGEFYVKSINDLDYTMVLGMTAFYGMFLVAANLLVDILYGIVDPRIKLAEKKQKMAEMERE